MKTKLEQALDCVVHVYHQYCILDPVDDYLHLREFQKLVKEQAQPFLQATTPPGLDPDTYICQLFRNADRDQNGYLKFTEFLWTFASILDYEHEKSHDLCGGQETSGQGHGHGHSH